MRKKIIIMLYLMVLIIPLNLKALSGGLSLSCSTNTLTVGSSTSCSISGYSDEAIAALTAKLTSSGSISLSNISTSSSWQGDGAGGNIDLYTDVNKTSFSVATFTVTGNSVGSGSVNIGGIVFTDGSWLEHSIGSRSLTITVKEVEVPKVEDTPVVTPPSSTNNNNNSNTNNTNVNVPQNNPTEVKKSNDATLKSLVLSNGVIEFSKDVLEYKVEVGNDIEKITINAISNDSKAQVLIPENLNLNVEENAFEIKVTAEDGTARVYKIVVTRLERVLSNNSNLKELIIDGYKINFSKENKIYDLKNINNSILKIKAVAEDINSKVIVKGDTSIGINDSVSIVVVAEDGTTSEYIIFASYEAKDYSNIILIIMGVLLVPSVIFNAICLAKIQNRKKQI